MGESVHGQIGQLLDYCKLSAIHPLKMPKIEKQDIPSFIKCPKYEKAKNALNQKMERYQSKVDRLNDDIRQMKRNIESMRTEQQKWYKEADRYIDNTSAYQVSRQNHAADMANSLLEKIERAAEKHDDLIDRRSEAKEEAQEKLQELTLEALLVIDEDIVAVLDRCTEIVGNLASSQNTDDLVEAIDICMIELRIFAMFEDLIEGNVERKECRARITEVDQLFVALCANEQISNYLVDMYQQNLNLVQKNDEIYHQVIQVLGSVDQGQLTNQTQSVNAVLTENINTTFEYKGIVDPAQLDEIIIQINKTITALNQSIVRANESETAASDFAKTGVDADQQANTLLYSMKSNVEDMKEDILSQNHYSVLMLDEAFIDDFYHKDVRSAVTALRRHLVSTFGEDKIDSLVKGSEDLFSLEKAENAIKQANLLLLQGTLAKIPAHIKKTNDLIASARLDSQEAGKVPQQNADALTAELGKKYNSACIPVFGLISAIKILGRLKAFEPAFRSTNQIYQNLANTLLKKNKKMTVVILVLGLIGTVILGFGNVVVHGILLVTYAVTCLLLTSVGKRLRSFLQK